MCLRTKAISFVQGARALVSITLWRMRANNAAIFLFRKATLLQLQKAYVCFSIHFSTAAFLQISQQKQGCSSIRCCLKRTIK